MYSTSTFNDIMYNFDFLLVPASNKRYEGAEMLYIIYSKKTSAGKRIWTMKWESGLRYESRADVSYFPELNGAEMHLGAVKADPRVVEQKDTQNQEHPTHQIFPSGK